MSNQVKLIEQITQDVYHALETAEILHHSFEAHKLRSAVEKLAMLEVEVRRDLSIVELCMRDLSYAGIEND